MAWRMAGTYVADCSCQMVCPCPVDGQPTGRNGECSGVAAFAIREGHLDDTDLGGASFAFYNHFPNNLTAGNWKMQLVVDDAASEEQAKALERIVSGQEGGPFADFVPLIADLLQTERAHITLDLGEAPSASVGRARFAVEPMTGPDGARVTIKNAPFAFAPEYAIGRPSGEVEGPFGRIDLAYGETAEFEFADQMTDALPRGRA